MNSLDIHYIIDYAINESLEFTCEDPVNEGKIMNGIKKLWKWITRKNKKNNEKNSYSNSSVNYNNDTEDDVKNDKEKTTFEIKEYSFSKLKQAQLKQEIKKTKKVIDKNDQDIKVLAAVDKQKEQVAGILTFVRGDKSPIAKKVEQFKNYAHIYSLEISKDYQEKGIGRMLIKAAKEKMESESTSQSKGFTIDATESDSKKIYKNIGFIEPYANKEKKINIMYAKYEDIDTDH